MFPYFVGNSYDRNPLFFRLSHPIVFPDPLAMNFHLVNPIHLPINISNFSATTTTYRRSFDYYPSVIASCLRLTNPSTIQQNYANYNGILINNERHMNGIATVHEVIDPNLQRDSAIEILEVDQTKELYFPGDTGMDFREKKRWTFRLRDAYKDFGVTFMDGLSKPFITVKGAVAVNYLTTVGFQGIILHKYKHTINSSKIIIFDVPIHINCSSLDFGSNVLWIKRRCVRGQPRQQLIASIKGPIPNRFFVPSLGYRAIAIVTNLPLLCLICSRWGHIKDDCIEDTYRCRFCSGIHNSQECLEKIRNNIHVPRRCCNCGDAHNASSEYCPMRPRTTFKMISHPSIYEAIRNCESIVSAAAAAISAAASAIAIEKDQLRIAILERALSETEMLKLLVKSVKDHHAFIMQNVNSHCAEFLINENGNNTSGNEKSLM
ncbi:uncharacterized protein [Palaemon carinicauda]|uniref:uncharacterized protein n=1 Tax=Palaemon carinicauda TaxID=392227 RepID=UPI0035B59E2D